MSSISLFEFTVRDDDLDAARAAVDATLQQTIAFPGSQGVDVLLRDDDPTTYVVVEYWDDLEADTAYRAWRAGDGVPTEFINHLAARPRLTHLHRDPQLAHLVPLNLGN